MKLNKKISKFLVLGILTNNLYFNSSANLDIPNRYETLDGEYITINDSTEGNLEEIEIFGNTAQDPDNLEDIQSVGDLYVDDDGNPILDRQGREQYKIDIVSQNKNLDNAFLNKNNPDKGWINSGNGTNPLKYSDSNSAFYTETHRGFTYNNLKPNTKYTFSADLKETGKIVNGHKYGVVFQNPIRGMMDIEFSSEWQRCSLTVTSNNNGSLYFIFYNSYYIKNVQLEEGSKNTDFFNREQNRISIILPTQLQKVGNVADKLYWDKSKCKYIIEKNIDKHSFTPEESWVFREDKTKDIVRFFIYSQRLNIMIKQNSSVISNTLKNIPYAKLETFDYEGIGVKNNSYTDIGINLSKSKLSELSSKGLSDWFIENPTIMYYQLDTPRYIETNIKKTIQIPTYKEITHLYVDSENGVNPILKVTIDRLPQIAKEAVYQAEHNNINYNISLARMYINMLPESLYKDQLQERLSQVFSSDITLDRESASSNLDVYVKSQNMLSMSLDTNSITFDGYSGVDAMEMLSAVNISINSSLPYDLNAYIPVEISNTDGINIMDLDILNIRESSEAAYQTFKNTTDKIVLKSDCVKGNDINHSIDLKLDSNAAHKADVYKTVIKFEAEQK